MFGEIKTTFRLFSLQILVFAAFFACSIQSANAQDANLGDIETGLVGHWKLDETSGTTAVDSIGTNDISYGSALSAGNVTKGVFGNARTFLSGPTGSNSSTTGITTLPEFTISLWVKKDSSATTGSDGIFEIPGLAIIQFSHSLQRITGSFQGWTTARGSQTPIRLNNNEWKHVVLTYSYLTGFPGTLRWYEDGVLVSGSNNFGGSGPYAVSSDTRIVLATRYNSSGATWDGAIDDIRIYNRMLSADDVALLNRSYPGQVACDATNEAVMIFNHKEKVMQYCNGTDWVNVGERQSVAPTSGLVGHWTLDDTNTTALASVGSNGTMTNGLNGASDSVTGKIGTAINFGVDTQLIDFGNILNMGTNDLSYSLWINPQTCASTNTGIVSNRNETGGGDGYSLRYNCATGNLLAVLGGNAASSYVATSPTDIRGAGWQHVAVNYDRDGNMELFLNGVSNATLSINAENGVNIATSRPLELGGSSDTGTAEFAGDIDDFKIFNRTLTSGEILAIYSAAANNGLGCTSPNGKAGEMDYNLEDGVMQYCDGENWISMGPKSAEAGVSADDLSTTAPTSGLIGHWPLNTNANDALGNSNGSLQNGATIITTNKKLGAGAVELDGTNDHVRVPTTSNINLAGASEMSVSLWIDLDSVSSGANSLIMWESVNNGNQSEPYRLNVWDAGGGQYFPSFELANASDTTVRLDAGNVNYNGFHHVVGTYDGAEMRIYVNGQLANSAAQTGVIKTPVDGALNVNLLIGSGEISTARFTNGTIDDVRLYNRKLEPEEVLDLYRASSLLGHWKLDDTSGTQITDSSINANHGVWADNEDSDLADDIITGPSNSALALDNDDQITIPAIANYNVGTGGSFTITLWYKTTDASISFLDAGGGNQIIQMGLDASRARFRVRDSLGNSTGLPYSLPNGPRADGAWHLAALVMDRENNSAHIYIDGIQEQIDTDISDIVGNIGVITQIRTNSNSDGLDLDDIRYYNRALSAAEIGLLYTATGGASNPITGCGAAGETCDDGTMYAGTSPDGSVPMYTTPADAPSAMPWNNGNSVGYTSTGATTYNEGHENTKMIVGVDSNNNQADNQPHQAAEYCWDLNAHGHTDWYLPSRNEIIELYNNHGSIGGFVVSGSVYYWSSTEDSTNNAFVKRMSDAYGTGNPKSSNRRVRCVRKGAGSSIGGACSSPDGVAGEIVYNDDYNIMQYCNGSEWVALGSDYSGSAVVLSAPAGTGDCTNIGDVCPDGTIYAGVSPDGNIRMFTTLADAPGGAAYSWNAGNASAASMPFVTADPCYFGGETGCQTGALNTSAAEAADSDTSNGTFDNHVAAKYCEDLVSNGKNDWYLPAQEELEILYNNRAAGSLSGTFASAYPASTYWSSSEVNNQAVINYSFDGSGGNNSTKENTWSVRCVRKDASSTPTDACFGSPSVGTSCDNGSIYAGLSPDGNTKMYMTSTAFESTEEWSSTETTLLNMISTTDGDGNTAALIATALNYEAAQYCDVLSAHGQTDWYLPAEDETANFWNGGTPIGGVDTSGAYYWTSTESDATRGRARNYNFGAMTQTAKANSLLVRCVRKDGSSAPSGPTCTATNCGGTGTEKVVFVTSTTYDGNIGGLAGADAACAARAAAGGLSGTYKAWFSASAANDPESTFTQATVPYELLNGTQIASNWTTLTDGSLDSTISIDEFGDAVATTEGAWGHTQDNGQMFLASLTCTAGTTNSSGIQGMFSLLSDTGAGWSGGYLGNCDTTYRLYCMEQ